MILFAKYLNKFDYRIILLIASLCLGNIGDSLQASRILTILFFPALTKSINQSYRYIKPFILFLKCFYIYCLISLIWTPDIIQGIKELVYYLIHICLFLEILVFSCRAKNALMSICLAWVIGMSLTIPVAAWEIATGNHIHLAEQYEDSAFKVGDIAVNRPFAAVTFGGFNGYVVYLCWAIPFLGYLLMNPNIKLKGRILLYIILISILSIIVVNASRGGILTVAVMMAIYLWMHHKGIGRIVVLFLGIFVVYYFISSDFDALSGVSSRLMNGALFSDDVRKVLWSKAIQLFLSSYGFGVGIGGISAAMASVNAEITYPHNLFLEFLAQYGWLFFILFLGFIIGMLKRAFRMKERSIKTVLFMSIFAMPLYSIVDSGYLINAVTYGALSSMAVFAYYHDIAR